MGTVTLEHGRPWPLGAHFDGEGINFAVFSAHASKLELCLFDESGQRETARLALPGHHVDVWHGYLRGARPGQVYGLRAHGPWRPDRGHRFNPHKLLLDPYAREIVGQFNWQPEHFGHDPLHPQHQYPWDNGATALKARVTHDHYDWRGDRAPHVPLADMVIYELHVKGFTQRHPLVPEPLRGRYAGLAHEASIAHLKRLGVTAVELLPVHQHVDERHLVRRGLSNYWGYNTIGFFCPEPAYAAGPNPRDEFRDMVRALHAAGIEVLLDVVFNHTCESDEHGPTLSWRGLDNAAWYRVPHDAPGRYENHTGCGNTLDLRQPRVLQFVMDSLRYWVREMHVDGFRFDLAPALARDDPQFSPRAAFFRAVAQDPVLAQVKLIAEPWDIGPGGYQMGNFPRGWLEWNDRFRDGMRGWWLRGKGTRGEFAQRLCASSDIFHRQHRAPVESINYVVSHDGFTLRDVVSYDHRHNEANGENGADGHAHNLSWNCGVEGPTPRADVLALRARLMRALTASVLLAQGTPMLAAGDELMHTQQGNNNPYCQDNAISWIDWSRADESLIEFNARLLRLRRELLPLANRWYTGLPDAHGLADLAWLAADGRALEGDAWNRADGRCLGALIGAPGRASAAHPGPLLLLVNSGATDQPFVLPAGPWQVLLDTSRADGSPASVADVPTPYLLPAHALVLLSRPAPSTNARTAP
jgi:glycogen operon protein